LNRDPDIDRDPDSDYAHVDTLTPDPESESHCDPDLNRDCDPDF